MAIDKAEWQYDSAMKEYCEATGKKQEELTSADEDTIWEYAGNHIAFFITWLIRRDLLRLFACRGTCFSGKSIEIRQ